ncbi:MAG: ribbon-helix-helix domain-containing protein [Phenylobacterium sp.]|jgi:predicted DNA-binding ribbon-helix-helix protein|uniref:ribbon-helix-helix domain-containing protein n=1 Tax=Phenylobacterium sp. TaxID=1871053 RepID=UPI00391AF96E
MPRLRKRSVLLAGHATSLALEPEFWTVLEKMAAAEGMSLAALIGRIDSGRADRPLASACRVAALRFAELSGSPAADPAA